jgi:hypothetical protein
MLASTIALLTLALIGAWTLGGLLLRLGGLTTMLIGLTHPAGLALAAVGSLAWLAGHWLYGLRHHAYKSPLARRIYLQLLPTRLDPTRHWTFPTTSRHG